jgi:hypothetical protein
MRLVKKALMQDDDTPIAIAEVLSGLLEIMPDQDNRLQSKWRQEQVQFDFKPGIRTRLQEHTTTADSIAVVRAVSTLLEQRLNRVAPGQDFRALLMDPSVLPPPELEGMEVFATLAAERIDRLGGIYSDYAAKLRAGACKTALLRYSSPAPSSPDELTHSNQENVNANDESEFLTSDLGAERLHRSRTNPVLVLNVFLSHTSEFADFPRYGSYVDTAKNAILNSGHSCVEMEMFSAQSGWPGDYDAQKVNECDVYLGILGMKYGSLTSKGISHTEHEYETALRAKKIRLIFILDPDSTNHGLPASALAPVDNANKQVAFKERVKRDSLVKFFKNPDHLYSLIRDAFLDLVQTPDDWIWPLPWDFGPYRAERSEGFKGREWLFHRVQSWATDPNAARALLLTSGFGVGKTAFLAWLVNTEASGLPLAAQHFCQEEVNDTLSPGRFVTSVAAQLAETIPAYKLELQCREARDLRLLLDDAAQKPVEAWDQAVVAPLHRIPKPDLDHLMVVDALDVALNHRPAAGMEQGVTIVDLLARRPSPPRWLRILATSRKMEDVIEQYRSSFDLVEINESHEYSLQDLKVYTEARCEMPPLKEKLDKADITIKQLSNILCEWSQSGGKFLYVESMLNAIEAGLIPLKDINSLLALPQGMSGFFLLSFNECAAKMDIHQILGILGVISQAREPLELSELASIFGSTKEAIRLSLQPIKTLLRWRTTQVMQNKKAGHQLLLGFDHPSLVQWLSQEDSHPYNIDLDKANEKIRSWALGEIKKGTAHRWCYLVRHLGSHIRDQERTMIMAKLLRNFDWIQARLEYASFDNLIQDFNSTALARDGDLVLKRIKRALLQAEHQLRNDPNHLAIELLNRLKDISNITDIQILCKAAKSWLKLQSK